MGKTLTEIAQILKDTDKKVQLIYAFNGVGKTRLSREFKELVAPKTEGEEAEEEKLIKVMLSLKICSIGIMIWTKIKTGS